MNIFLILGVLFIQEINAPGCCTSVESATISSSAKKSPYEKTAVGMSGAPLGGIWAQNLPDEIKQRHKILLKHGLEAHKTHSEKESSEKSDNSSLFELILSNNGSYKILLQSKQVFFNKYRLQNAQTQKVSHKTEIDNEKTEKKNKKNKQEKEIKTLKDQVKELYISDIVKWLQRATKEGSKDQLVEILSILSSNIITKIIESHETIKLSKNISESNETLLEERDYKIAFEESIDKFSSAIKELLKNASIFDLKKFAEVSKYINKVNDEKPTLATELLAPILKPYESLQAAAASSSTATSVSATTSSAISTLLDKLSTPLKEFPELLQSINTTMYATKLLIEIPLNIDESSQTSAASSSTATSVTTSSKTSEWLKSLSKQIFDLRKTKKEIQKLENEEEEYESKLFFSKTRRIGKDYDDYEKHVFDPEQTIVRIVDDYMEKLDLNNIKDKDGNKIQISSDDYFILNMHTRFDMCPYCIMYLAERVKEWQKKIPLFLAIVSSRQEYRIDEPWIKNKKYAREGSMRSVGTYVPTLSIDELNQFTNQPLVIQYAFPAAEAYNLDTMNADKFLGQLPITTTQSLVTTASASAATITSSSASATATHI